MKQDGTKGGMQSHGGGLSNAMQSMYWLNTAVEQDVKQNDCGMQCGIQ